MSTRLTSHGVLLYCEGWGVLGETPRKIHIAKKVALGPQQLWNLCGIEVFIQGSQLFSPSSALALSAHSLSKRQRSNLLTYLCHLVSSFNFEHLPDTIFVDLEGENGSLQCLHPNLCLGTLFTALGEKKNLIIHPVLVSIGLKWYATLKFPLSIVSPQKFRNIYIYRSSIYVEYL